MKYQEIIEKMASGVFEDIEKMAEEEEVKVPFQKEDEDEDEDEEDEDEVVGETVAKAAALLEDAILRKQAAEAVYDAAVSDMEVVAAAIEELGGDFEKFAESVVEEMEK